MNIINIGGWYVGNSAVLDWLDGFEEISFVKGDFNIMRLENGIMDMINASSKEKKLEIIKINKIKFYLLFLRKFRSFVYRYTKNINKKKPSVSYNDFFSFQKLLYSYLNNYELRVKQEIKFDEVVFWKAWLDEVAFIFSEGREFKNTVYQNPFFYDETFDGHKDIWPNLLDPYKLVFVHRDPLDQFADIVNAKAHLHAYWPRFHGSTGDMHPADRFLEISKKIYNARLRMADEYNENQLIIFSFEDFLKNHDRVTDRLKTFLNIKTQRNPKNKNFLIKQSLRNIGKGESSQEVNSLLKGKGYVIDEINYLREKIINHRNSI